ncbi:histidine phosphatase family protein [Microbacterium sp.]|uniref:histidine phosphatase family protein n=1 Tax=Microbacterium sp. TaxID=51671 RepID=UPI0028125970|nr:histidine phosphatase family protein [Microbacterium sp.]
MPSLPRRITLVRHAMPVVDVAVDPAAWSLSAEGAAAASALHLATDAVAVSSPELKALQTVALARGVATDEVAVDARFREVDRVEAVHDGFREARRAWVTGVLDSRHEGWEHPDAAARRFHEGLLAHPAEHLVVGTHGMVLTAWMVARGLVAPGAPAAAFWEALGLPAVVELGAERPPAVMDRAAETLGGAAPGQEIR